MKVPFLDLAAHHAPLRAEFDRAIGEVIDSGAFAGGRYVELFEADFAAYCGAKHAIGVGNGTEALWLALAGAGIGPGDEVITVANSFFATAEAISFAGATPIFVDVDPVTYLMDVQALEAAITPRTKAVIPVHLFGQTADMDPIMALAQEHGFIVIEDAAQAHGAEYKGRRAGTLGHIACFSFYPGKNLGAFGEAGAVVTNRSDWNDTICMLRDHGQSQKYHHKLVGWNGRMDGIQAAVLRIKLQHLDGHNASRLAHALHYDERLAASAAVQTPGRREGGRHVYHLYPVRVKNRDEVMKRLGEKQIGCGIHYPVPIHLQEAYEPLGLGKGTFPVAEQCALEFLSLPMFPELKAEEVDYVADMLLQILDELN